jgi:predicted DNA-binding transcriptional regulator AlpA
MSEPVNPFDPFFAEIRRIIREEVEHALSAVLANGHPPEKEKLLTPEEAAEIIGVDKKWLYAHTKGLPFRRKLSHKAIRFSEPGLRRWMAAQK